MFSSVVEREEYRFFRKIIWDANLKIAMWVGLNPGTQNPLKEEAAVRVKRTGFGGVILVNIYPYVAYTVSDLKIWRNSFGKHIEYNSSDVFHENIDYVKDAIRGSSFSVAAWGAGLAGDGCELYKRDIVTFLAFINGTKFYSFGVTQNGSPRNPSGRGKNKVKDNAVPQIWSRP